MPCKKNNLNVAVTYKTPLSDICFDVFCLIDSSSLLSIHYLYYSVRKRTFLNIHQPNRLSKNQIPSYYISVIYPSIIRNVLHLNSLALTYFRQVLWCFFIQINDSLHACLLFYYHKYKNNFISTLSLHTKKSQTIHTQQQ